MTSNQRRNGIKHLLSLFLRYYPVNIKRFEFYRDSLYFNYNITKYVKENRYDDNNFWLYNEWYSIHIGFDKHWFKYNDIYYDGQTYRSIVIAGLEIGYSYSYTAESL